MFSICTYNIWNENREVEQRLTTLIEIFAHYRPTILCLQEVTDEMYPVLVRELMPIGYYTAYDLSLSVQGKGYGEVIFLDKSCKKVKDDHQRFTQTHQNRMFHTVSFLYKNYKFNVITSHLDGVSAEVRANQLQELDNYVSTCEGISFIGLDTNIKQEETVECKGMVDVFDICKHMLKAKDVYTWETKFNQNLRATQVEAERYDRVYISKRKNAKEAEVLLEAYELIGTHPIPQTSLHPSDHYGVLVDFSIQDQVFS